MNVLRKLSLGALVALLAGCPTFDRRALPNAPPVAVVEGPAGTVGKNAPVQLDGSKSADPEGKPLVFRWSQVGGEGVALANANGPVLSFDAPSQAGSLVFSLTVNDGLQDSAAAFAKVEVAFNTAPVADAGGRQETETGRPVLLVGSASDADGDEVSAWKWAVSASPGDESYALSGEATRSLLFTPRARGVYTISLVATDARGAASAPSTAVIAVADAAPVLAPGPAASGPNGTRIELTASAVDADAGDSVTYEWTLDATPAGAALPELSGLGTATLAMVPHGKGLYAFTVRAGDGEKWSAPARRLVSALDNAPTVEASAIDTVLGAATPLAARSFDADGDAVTIDWVMSEAGGKPFVLQSTVAGPAFTALAKGAYVLRATPKDAEKEGESALVTVTARDRAPEVTLLVGDDDGTGPVAHVRNGSPLALAARAIDPDGDAVNFAWTVAAAPPGSDTHELSGADTSRPVFTPKVRGPYTISLVVTDADGVASAPATLAVVSDNAPPVVTAPPSVRTPNARPARLSAIANDPEGDRITYHWKLESAPGSAALPDVSGEDTASLDVTPHGRGVYAFTVTASDGHDDSEPVRVLLSSENNPPTVTVPAQTVPDHAQLLLAAPTADADGDAVSVRWSVVDANGRAFLLAAAPGGGTYFTPGEKGTWTLEATPSDGADSGTPARGTVTATNLAPVAAGALSAEAVGTGESFTIDGSASGDPDGPVALRFAWTVRQGSATITSGATSAKATFQAGAVKETVVVELVVTDEVGEKSTIVLFRVAVDNTAPTAVAAGDRYVDAGGTGNLDGSASNDLETASGSLRYEWTCTSHPALSLFPSAFVRNPTYTAPATPGTKVTFRLVVSDGRQQSAPATFEATTVPSDATSVFVRADAACGATCDGTKAKPFATITAAAAAAASSGKPVLVAAGSYGATSVPSGVDVTGGCDTTRWLSDGTAGATVVRAGPSDLVALDVSGNALNARTIQNLTVYGSTGAGVPNGSTVAGVRCNGCKANFDTITVGSDGTGPNVQATHAVEILNTGGPVKVTRVTATSGSAWNNAALTASGSSNVTVQDSSFDTLTKARSGGVNENDAVVLAGPGTNVLLTRNRLVAQGDASVSAAHVVGVYGDLPAVISGNQIWLRANASGAYYNCCNLGAQTNVGVFLQGTGGVRMLNNTFLGNDAAFGGSATMQAINIWNGGASGVNYATNNYFQRWKTTAFSISNATVVMAGNAIFDFTNVGCGPYDCNGNPEIMSLGWNPSAAQLFPRGSPTYGTSDCRLANPLTGDIHLKSGSPCLDAGLADPYAPQLDLDGDLRPAGSAIDVGADEVSP